MRAASDKTSPDATAPTSLTLLEGRIQPREQPDPVFTGPAQHAAK